MLNQQYSNQASLQPRDPWRKTATTWLLHNSVLRPTASPSQHIPSTAYVPTVLNELHVPHCCGPLLQLVHHEMVTGGIQGLINCLCRTFTNIWHPWWVHQDSGPEFTATATCQFLKERGVHQCLWSEAFPHSNCQAEIGVKTVKHFITNKTHVNAHGNIETDSLYHATLQYPDPNTKLSTAQYLGNQTRTSHPNCLATTNHIHTGLTPLPTGSRAYESDIWKWQRALFSFSSTLS